MVTAAQVAELKRFNAGVSTRLSRELNQLRSPLLGVSPDRARDALLELAPALTDKYGSIAGSGAADWYERVRRTDQGGSYAARVGPRPDHDAVRQNVRWAAGALFTDSPLATFTLLAASLDRRVMDVPRDTVSANVINDPRAVGWQRLARPGGCDFCLMLSQRGFVYRKSTADFASHDNCACTAAPSWDRNAPEVDVRAYEASERTSGMSPRQKARHDARTREWMESQKWRLDDFRAAMS